MKRKLKRLQMPRKGIQYIIYPETREELSPFAFFDAGTMQRNDDGLFIGMHPHSGIGIVTYFEGGNLLHDDTGKNDNTIKDGGVQWIRAGGGVWHQENYIKREDAQSDVWPLTIHQLWLQLPPELEEGEVEYQNIQPEQLPVVGSVKVVVGEFEGEKSPLKVPYNMTYLDVKLRAGESFSFQTPEGQTQGFVFPRKGAISLHGEELPLNHLSILENNMGDVEITATSDTAFVMAMTEPASHPIITQGGSIHSNEGAMARSFERIEQLRQEMKTTN